MKPKKVQKIIGVKELRENLEHYIKLVKRGMHFTVVRRSKPVFDITPAESAKDERWETVIDFTKFKSGGIDIKDLIRRLS